MFNWFNKKEIVEQYKGPSWSEEDLLREHEKVTNQCEEKNQSEPHFELGDIVKYNKIPNTIGYNMTVVYVRKNSCGINRCIGGTIPPNVYTWPSQIIVEYFDSNNIIRTIEDLPIYFKKKDN